MSNTKPLPVIGFSEDGEIQETRIAAISFSNNDPELFDIEIMGVHRAVNKMLSNGKDTSQGISTITVIVSQKEQFTFNSHNVDECADLMKEALISRLGW